MAASTKKNFIFDNFRVNIGIFSALVETFNRFWLIRQFARPLFFWKFSFFSWRPPLNSRAKNCGYFSSFTTMRRWCISMSTTTYAALENTSTSWICCKCGLPNFHSSFFDSTIATDENRFSDLSSDSMLSSVNSPRATSSPVAPPAPSRRGKKSNLADLKMMSVNCCSVRSEEKQRQLFILTETHQPDVIFGCESHIDKSYSTSETFPPAYTTYRKDRAIGGGGFSSVYTRRSFHHLWQTSRTTLSQSGPKSADLMGNHYTLGHFIDHQMAVLSLYMSWMHHWPRSRRLQQHRTSLFLEISTCLTSNGTQWHPSPLLPMVTRLMKSCWTPAREHFLSQRNERPTRGNNILDIVLTSYPALVDSSTTAPGMSDHAALLTTAHVSVKPAKKQPRTIFLYNRGDMDGVRQDLKNLLPRIKDPTKSTEAKWTTFRDAVSDTIKRHIPTKHTSTRWDVPWMTRPLKRLVRKKQGLFRKAKATNKPRTGPCIKDLRRKASKTLAAAHHNYIQGLLHLPADNDPAKASMGNKFWSYVNSRRRTKLASQLWKTTSTERHHPVVNSATSSTDSTSLCSRPRNWMICHTYHQAFPRYARDFLQRRGHQETSWKHQPQEGHWTGSYSS